MRKKVLFLCTGNTCRSQMAEALVNARLSESWQASSAGVQPASEVNPYTGKVLAELGIVHLGQPKHPDVFKDQAFDLVVTLCDDAADNCPVWLGPGRKQHLGFPDPATARGSEEQVLPIYRQVLKDMATRLPAMLEREFNQGYASLSHS